MVAWHAVPAAIAVIAGYIGGVIGEVAWSLYPIGGWSGDYYTGAPGLAKIDKCHNLAVLTSGIASAASAFFVFRCIMPSLAATHPDGTFQRPPLRKH